MKYWENFCCLRQRGGDSVMWKPLQINSIKTVFLAWSYKLAQQASFVAMFGRSKSPVETKRNEVCTNPATDVYCLQQKNKKDRWTRFLLEVDTSLLVCPSPPECARMLSGKRGSHGQRFQHCKASSEWYKRCPRWFVDNLVARVSLLCPP